MKPLTAWFRSNRCGKCAECRKVEQRERYNGGHPPMRERVAALEKIVAELQAKVA
jgi:hypothetical protein